MPRLYKGLPCITLMHAMWLLPKGMFALHFLS
jgi:hypothetical protein